MTGRERLTAIINRQPTDRLSWGTLVDDATLSIMPPSLSGNGGMDLYRHLDCDVFLLNAWATPHAFRSPELRWPEGVREVWREEDGKQIQEWQTPWGTLTAVFQQWHPIKYPVDSLEALRIYRQMREGVQFITADDTTVLASIDGMLGDMGIVSRFWGPSTIPMLLEYAMGTEQFYYLLADYPVEMEGLFATIHAAELGAFHALAQGPCEVVTLCENTSTAYIGPEVYRRYNMPHVRDFVDIMHAAGKTALIHMCGHIRDILPDIRETGLDGIHALTPAPTGNTPWELALDVLGEELVILGILDPSIFCLLPVDEIGPALDTLYTPRLRRAHFYLWCAADGLATPLERFEAVRRWMEKNGG